MGVSNAPLRLLTTATVGAVCYWILIRRWRTPALLDLLDTLDHSGNRLAIVLAGESIVFIGISLVWTFRLDRDLLNRHARAREFEDHLPTSCL